VTYIPAVREDVALGIASAAHLTGRHGGILMQNSGLGNVVNPLTSFNLIYRIPVLMLVSWRGYGGKDAPEHLIMGEKTPELLHTLGIPHTVLEADTLEENLQWAISTMEQQLIPVAVILRQGDRHMMRHEALEHILTPALRRRFALFTTGMISREAFNIRDRAENFYMIGSMGLLNALGLGLALQSPMWRIWVIEGDGSALMSLGTLPLIATLRAHNLIHVVLDNEVYESTGGQPTISSEVDLAALAEAAGYARVWRLSDPVSLQQALQEAEDTKILTFILVKVTGRAPEGLGRVSLTPEEIKRRFSQVLTRV